MHWVNHINRLLSADLAAVRRHDQRHRAQLHELTTRIEATRQRADRLQSCAREAATLPRQRTRCAGPHPTYAGTMFSNADLPLYYEWHGEARADRRPLLLIHGGGSTIESNWGRLIPLLRDSRRLLAVELQGHGRTGAGEGPASFERSADGVAALLAELGVGPVDVLGFSNGGQVAMQLAARHPAAAGRLVVASAPFRRDGMIDGFWEGMAGATFEHLPQVYRDADLAVSGDPAHAERMFDLDHELMLTGFTDWPDALPAAIAAPTLVVVADRDVVRVEHAARLAALIPGARLLVVPGNHGDYLGELAAASDPGPLRRTLPFIEDFLA
ncbi:alpha/beta fold hydrolase [Dactylosporangium sp. NPDC006015]|uniref:alpha/beta fold hydrolase n=1 Tax=Dactylosporangium sp. NPDC006015 TaxID=3154576 RepID=UPI0033BFAAB5